MALAARKRMEAAEDGLADMKKLLLLLVLLLPFALGGSAPSPRRAN